MAEDLTPPDSEPARQRPLVQRLTHPEEYRIHRWRFGIAYLALAVFAGVGAGVTIVLLDRPAKAPEQPWSSWKPTGRENTFPSQIADHVARRYKLPSGKTLVGVIPSSPPAIQVDPFSSLRISAVLIQEEPTGNGDPDLRPVRTDDSLMFVLCGVGDQCSIRDAEPTPEQLQLLRREALELALYSFKYVDDLDSVIALLPPRPPATQTEQVLGPALFFQRKDFGYELGQPLRATLASGAPQVAEIDPRESVTVDQLTQSNLFAWQFTRAQEGSAYLLLAPIGD